MSEFMAGIQKLSVLRGAAISTTGETTATTTTRPTHDNDNSPSSTMTAKGSS
jgi:hypothetical protein